MWARQVSWAAEHGFADRLALLGSTPLEWAEYAYQLEAADLLRGARDAGRDG